MVDIAGRRVDTNDAVVMGAGVLMLIDSFLHWFSFYVYSYNAFDAGFLSWFPVLLVWAVAGIAAAKVFAGQTIRGGAQIGPALLLLILSGAATVLLVLKLLIGYHGTDRSFGLFLGILIAAAQAAFAFLSFRTSGEAAPDLKNLGGSGPGAGGPGGYGPPPGSGPGTPPPGGYPPPPPPPPGYPPPPPPGYQPPAG